MRRRLAIPALNEHGAKRTAAEAREGMELARRGVAPFIRAGRSEIFTRLGREAAERAARVRCRVGRWASAPSSSIAVQRRSLLVRARH